MSDERETQRLIDAVEDAKALEHATIHAWNLLMRRAPLAFAFSIPAFVIAVQQAHAGMALTVSLTAMIALWLYGGWCIVQGQVTCPKEGGSWDAKLRPHKVTAKRIEAERKLNQHLLRDAP